MKFWHNIISIENDLVVIMDHLLKEYIDEIFSDIFMMFKKYMDDFSLPT